MKRPSRATIAAAALAVIAAADDPRRGRLVRPKRTLTAVAGIKVGHHTLTERPTGCTVDPHRRRGATGGVDVRGGAPGHARDGPARPVNSVQKVNAIVLSGGSAFGLDAGRGVMRWLDEQRHRLRRARWSRCRSCPPPSCSTSAFGGKPKVRPDRGVRVRGREGRHRPSGRRRQRRRGRGRDRRQDAAGPTRIDEGRDRHRRHHHGRRLTVVAALVAVNAVGDIIDPATGRWWRACAPRTARRFATRARSCARGRDVRVRPPRPAENTTIGVVATNATLTKVQARKVAQMAHDGFARAISPVHTPGDGDTIFALATGTRPARRRHAPGA